MKNGGLEEPQDYSKLELAWHYDISIPLHYTIVNGWDCINYDYTVVGSFACENLTAVIKKSRHRKIHYARVTETFSGNLDIKSLQIFMFIFLLNDYMLVTVHI